MAHSFAIFVQKFNALMFCSSVNRFGVTYQGKIGDDIEVRVDGLVERFVIFIIIIIIIYYYYYYYYLFIYL